MTNISSLVEKPITKLKNSLKSVENISEETISKWRIGRRNFP